MRLAFENIRTELSTSPGVVMAGIPLTGTGNTVILPTLLGGGTLVVSSACEANALAALVHQHRVTRLILTPSMLIDLLDLPDSSYDLSSLTSIIYGSEITPAPKIAEAVKRFGPILLQVYGSAELMPPLAVLEPHEHVDATGAPADRNILSSAGRILPGVGIRIFDNNARLLNVGQVGRILVRSPTVFDRYLGAGPGEAPEAWFSSGDLGFVDHDNRLHVLGRRADVIVRRNGVTYPREVEEVMHEHEAVKECCLVQVGHHAVLIVSPRRAFAERVACAPDVFEAELRSLGAARLEAKDTPDQIVVVSDLPRSVLAKVVRREIRAHFESGTLARLNARTHADFPDPESGAESGLDSGQMAAGGLRTNIPAQLPGPKVRAAS